MGPKCRSGRSEEIIPGRLNDPERFAVVGQRHLQAFRWEQQGWIPLGLIVNDSKHSRGITLDQWLDPDVFLTLQANILRDTLEVSSDITPSIALNHMGNAIYPSLFGAKITIPAGDVNSVQESGPWIFPALEDIANVDRLCQPSMPSALVDQAERFIRFYREHLPQWVRVVSPSKIGPFSLAQLLRGSEFYLDLATDPQRCHKLLDLCTNCLIETEQYLRSVAHQSCNEHYSEFGIMGPGPRIGDDSLINISPDMIREFALPYFGRIAQAFTGQLCVHFCSLEKSRGEHVYETLIEDPCIFAASSQFGFEYYAQNVECLQGRLAIESFYGDAMSYVTNEYGSFEAWAMGFVRRFKDRSGLVLYCEVGSVDEGRHLWEIWQRAHRR